MKKLFACAFCLLGAVAGVAFAACVDYSDPGKPGPDAAAVPSAEPTGIAPAQQPSPSSTAFVPPPVDAGNACASLSYRGGAPDAVVCPGVAKCACAGGEVCCMQRVDSTTGACTTLAACRDMALACDGPEDCDGAVCCLEDRTGGGSSCKAAASCATGQWLCRSDVDCAAAPAGPHCAPIDLGMPGVDDRGLDGIVGTCGK